MPGARLGILVLSSLSLSPCLQAQANPTTTMCVTVYIFNSAHVSPSELSKAEILAGSIFRTPGIKFEWVAGLTDWHADDSPTHKPWNPANLALRIRDRSMVPQVGIRSDAMGFCPGVKGREAILLLDRIHNNAARLSADPAVVLGITLAHEIGHLLLQSATHSLAGVMKARLVPEDVAAAERGSLRFTWRNAGAQRNGSPAEPTAANDTHSASDISHGNSQLGLTFAEEGN
jgi:hypothetical protein